MLSLNQQSTERNKKYEKIFTHNSVCVAIDDCFADYIGSGGKLKKHQRIWNLAGNRQEIYKEQKNSSGRESKNYEKNS